VAVSASLFVPTGVPESTACSDFCYEFDESANKCVWTCEEGDANGYRPGQPPPDCVDVWYPNSNGYASFLLLFLLENHKLATYFMK
jgi:hypothetical protein